MLKKVFTLVNKTAISERTKPFLMNNTRRAPTTRPRAARSKRHTD